MAKTSERSEFHASIRKVTDAPLIADIYNYYVDNTCITFALEHSTPQIYANMIVAEKYPFLVAETDDGQLSGFIFCP